MEHGAWAAWKWVGKAEAGISEGSDANKADFASYLTVYKCVCVCV